MALQPPPPNIRAGSERVLEPNVRWGGGGCTPWVIPVRGLMAPGILGAQDEHSNTAVGALRAYMALVRPT